MNHNKSKHVGQNYNNYQFIKRQKHLQIIITIEHTIRVNKIKTISRRVLNFKNINRPKIKQVSWQLKGLRVTKLHLSINTYVLYKYNEMANTRNKQ